MERLTGRYETGIVHVPQGMMPEALDRLAAYEDTGLEPEQVAELKGFMQGGIHKVDDGWAHVQELVEAEKHGRLVVLPCKVGDTVWELVPEYCDRRGRDICNEYCDGWNTHCPEYEGEMGVSAVKFTVSMFEKIGKTVFLTREEAEAALKKG